MSFQWIEFSTPIAITETKSWTAIFDSYDQRNDNCYYQIWIHEQPAPPVMFMAQVRLYWAGDNWETPRFDERLKEELHQIANQGVTNTTWRGSGC